jgi:hypothetical protein
MFRPPRIFRIKFWYLCSSTHVSNDVGILGNDARKEQELGPGEHRQGDRGLGTGSSQLGR